MAEPRPPEVEGASNSAVVVADRAHAPAPGHVAGQDAEGGGDGKEADLGLARLREDALPLLNAIYGFDSFRENQLEALRAFVDLRRDVFVELSTGAGKSLIFEMSSLLLTQRHAAANNPGEAVPVVFVVGPLRDVLTQAAARLRSRLRSVPSTSQYVRLSKKLEVGVWSSTDEWYLDSIDVIPDEEDRKMMIGNDEDVLQGKYSLVLTTPEKVALQRSAIARAILDGLLAPWVCVDECDIAIEWSSFRPSYRQLNPKRWFHQAPTLCLTATATRAIRLMLCAQFGLSNTAFYRGSIDRPVMYELLVIRNRNIFESCGRRVLEELSLGGKVLIYVHTPKEAVEAAEEFRRKVSPASMVQASHAVLDAPSRRLIIKLFETGSVRLLFATAVLARGLDVADISMVVVTHFTSISYLFQCFGRISRSPAVLLTRQPRCIVCYKRVTSPVCEMNCAWDAQKSWVEVQEKVFVQRFLASEMCVRKITMVNYYEAKTAALPPRSGWTCCSVCQKYNNAERRVICVVPEAAADGPEGYSDFTEDVLFLLEVLVTPNISVNDAGILARAMGSDKPFKSQTKASWLSLIYFMEQTDFLSLPSFPGAGSDSMGGVIVGSRRLTRNGKTLLHRLRAGLRCLLLFHPDVTPGRGAARDPRPIRQHLSQTVFEAAAAQVQSIAARHGVDVLRAPLLFPFAELRGDGAVPVEERTIQAMAEQFSREIVMEAQQNAVIAADEVRKKVQDEKKRRRVH